MEAVPRLMLGYRIKLRAYSVSLALLTVAIYYVYVAQFDCNGVNREAFHNMKHVSGQTICGISLRVSWLMLGAGTCRPVKHMRVSGALRDDKHVTAASVLCTAHSQAFVLSLYFDTEPKALF